MFPFTCQRMSRVVQHSKNNDILQLVFDFISVFSRSQLGIPELAQAGLFFMHTITHHDAFDLLDVS